MLRWKPLVILSASSVVVTLLLLPSVRSNPSQSTPSVPPLIDSVYARFDPRFPGRGVTDYPGNTVEDIPKSYAMILLAELDRRRHNIRPDLPNLARTAGRWLLDNAHLNADGATGWGVPVAWDAYGDGSENPENTVYSISTAIVADALISWMEASPRAPERRIVRTLSAALDEFARARRTPDQLLPYSLERSDRPYDTFNSAAYLAGQMQRFAKYATSPALARRLERAADATVASLVRNHRTSPTNSWYWQYSKQEKTANDMPHASYIIDGLRTYVRESGRLAGRVDRRAVVRHLRDFFDGSGRPRAWPFFQRDIDLPPRLYDLGIALHLTCTEPTLGALTGRLRATIHSYRSRDGFLKFPEGTPDQQALVVNEYEAYLWRGLVSCAKATRIRRKAQEARASAGARRGPASDVPFVVVGSGRTRTDLTFAGGRSTLTLPWSPRRRVTEDGLVLQAIDDSAGGVLITRNHPENDLSVVTLDRRGERAARPMRVEVTAGSAPMLRAAMLRDGVLHLVYYDNPTLQNYLARYVRRPQGYVAVGDPEPLPSFEDPSGGTYEMIPAVFLVQNRNSAHLIAGTLQATINDGPVTTERIENCTRALEAIATPQGPVTLCAQRTERGPGAPFELHGPDGLPLPAIDAASGIPFGLHTADGEVRLRFASSPRSLAAMLRFDLQRTNAGWLEYGTDNVEGRIPWSQIYYLNGFLDFLLLADDVPGRWKAFAPVLAGMRTRLDQELPTAMRHWQHGRYATRAFTVDRSPALFAVQTSRLLLVADRYATELRGTRRLPEARSLRAAVATLAGHIEILTRRGQDPRWLSPGTPHLKWPKGSAFPFDGLNVPYNHQNEWAYALARVTSSERSSGVARAIVSHFLQRVAPAGRLPRTGTWDYWWGQAYDGWTKADGVSTNTPEYPGDHIAAGMSFRSIDTMSALAVAPMLDRATRSHLRSSAARLIRRDKLYPFVNYELRRAGSEVRLPTAVARRYLRVSSPWELQNAAWAYAAELARLRSTSR